MRGDLKPSPLHSTHSHSCPDEIFFQVAVLVVRILSLDPHAITYSLLENFDFRSFLSLFPVVEVVIFLNTAILKLLLMSCISNIPLSSKVHLPTEVDFDVLGTALPSAPDV